MIYGYVKGAALEAEVKRLAQEWRLLFPGEYARWADNIRAQKEQLRDARAFSAGKTMQFHLTLPAHVHMGVGRFLQNHNWTEDPESIVAVLSVFQSSKMAASKA